MTCNSAISKTAAEYAALQIVLRGLEGDDHDAPEILLERQSTLVQRLIASPASSGPELAYKAHVLLGWIEGDDLPSELTLSLCRDTVRVFPFDAHESSDVGGVVLP